MVRTKYVFRLTYYLLLKTGNLLLRELRRGINVRRKVYYGK